MADRQGNGAAAAATTTRNEPRSPPIQWTRLNDGSGLDAPGARSGHAMALLPPSRSLLLFGGSNGKVFFDDFYVLEPTQYASLKGPRPTAAKGKQKMKKPAAKAAAAAVLSERQAPTLVWKKLVVSQASRPATDGAFPTSSFGSDASGESPRGSAATAVASLDAQLGCGRDYHTMHYAPSTDEKAHGFRVLVVGNPVVSPDDADDGSADAGASQPPEFDADEMRVNELRVKQPLLEAQWVPCAIKSMWKPRARNGHCSTLFGDQLFCFGGKNAAMTTFYDDFFYFDVALNQWREPPTTGTAPSARAFADMAVSATQEQIFVFGGHDDKRQYGGLFMFDVRSSRWDKIASHGERPETRINHTLTHIEPHHLVLFGGRKRTTRRNDLFLYDLSTHTWKQLGAQVSSLAARERRSKRVESQSESQGSSQACATQSSPSSVLRNVSKGFPAGRTAHSAIFYECNDQQKQQIIVFGGYAGSHSWLNDLHLLEITPIPLQSRQESSEADLSSPSRELIASRRPSPRSQSSGSNSSTARSSSRSSLEGGFVLSDITNIAPPKPSPGTDNTSPEGSNTSYTPAAVAARRRRLAEMEAKRESPSAQKRRRSYASATCTSQSQNLSHGHSQTRDPTSHSGERFSPPDALGLQTTMIQLLQYQQRMDSSLTLLSSMVRDNQSSSQREAIRAQQVVMQRQNELLENKLEAMTKRYESMQKKVQTLEKDKQVCQEQLVAAETEVYIHKKNLEELLPKLNAQVLEAVEKAGRSNRTGTHMIEAKLSAIHDMLEDIRNYSGERTETDDSPEKRNSMFPEHSSSPQASQHGRTLTPTVLYPQTIVRELEQKLDDLVQENQVLHQRLAVLDDKLTKSEGNAQRIHEISMAMLRYRDQEEEVKGE